MKNTFSCLAGVLLLTSILIVAIEIQPTQGSEALEVEWSRTYGGFSEDRAYSVVQTSEGYAIAGTTLSSGAGNGDYWLVKTDSAGNVLWNKTYGGGSEDRVRFMIETFDEGYAIGGFTYSFGAGLTDFWIVKTDANGNMEWNQTYGGQSYDQPYSIVQTSDEGYAIAGYTQSYGAGNRDFWLVKTDSLGNKVWSKTYGGSGDDTGLAVVQTSAGGYAIAGYSQSFGAGGPDFWLVVTDNNGDMMWNQTYGETGEEIAISMTSNGGYALVGIKTLSSVEGRDLWLVLTDTDGNLVANRTYGGPDEEGCNHGHALISTSDGGYAIAGYTKSFGAGSYDFWFIKTDALGNLQWNQTYGGLEADAAHSVTQTSDGGYAIVGYTTSYGAGGRDFWLVKLAPKIPLAATVDIDPNTLNLWSNGNWITTYIELPEGYDVHDIDLSAIELNDTVAAELYPTCVGDSDGDGIPDLMVKFDRAAVAAYIMANVDSTLLTERRGVTITLTVTGNLGDGTAFEGSDTIRVMCRGGGGIGKHALLA